ncbi:methyl-accepting chemotaxis protein [Natroniella sp. ANB-PHB2]|uniref:methyl-accepting chemotaxis protein n=1 Tax=Natroniella sp. ANB-PHB2 TaxID=3384444 RepID=UPI0038D3F164
MKLLELIKDKLNNRNKRENIVAKTFNNLSFKHKLILSFLIIILVFLLGSGVNLLFFREISNNFITLEESGTTMHKVLELANIIRDKYIASVDLANDNQRTRAVRRFERYDEEFNQIIKDLDQKFSTRRTRNSLTELINLNDEFNRIFYEELIAIWRIKEGEDVPKYNGPVDYQVAMIAIVNTRDDMIHVSNVLNNFFIRERERSIEQFGYNINLNYISSTTAIIISFVVAIIITIILRRNLINSLEGLVKVSHQLAKGNLQVDKLEIRTNDQIGKLAKGFNLMIDNLTNLISKIKATVQEVTSHSQELSTSASEADLTIEGAATTIQEMSAGIRQVASSSQEVMEFSQEVAEISKVGNEKISDSIEQMKKINQSVRQVANHITNLDKQSEKICEINELISGIAEQTNLLALNAAIEAARAGEAGQGFAVVAEEIRNLADETAEATTKIEKLISQNQEYSNQATSTIKEEQEEVEKGERIIKEAGQAFNKVNEAIDETVINLKETTVATEGVASAGDGVLDSTNEIKSISHEVTLSAENLAKMADDLNILIQEFEV